ncbi:MAG: acyltransferase family protein [Lachnospiraceae bacterium]|nr:acyltransferase family protein [Lachnospiraceae bacterium]
MQKKNNDAQEKKNRIEWIDYAKGLGILFVYYGHLGNPPGRDWIYSFHMPLFFILSGMLIKLKNEQMNTLIENIRKKARTILYPYVSFSIILLTVSSILFFGIKYTSWIVRTKQQAFQNLYSTLIGSGIGTLWFLIALFFGEIVLLWVLKNKIRLVCSFLIAFLSVILLWRFENDINALNYYVYEIARVYYLAVFSFLFVSVGYYLFGNINKVIKCEKIMRSAIVFIGALVINVICVKLNIAVDLHNLEIGNPMLYFLGALSGTICVILVCSHLNNLLLLDFFGKNSLLLMAINNMTIWNRILLIIYLKIGIDHEVLYCIYMLIGLLIGSSIVCIFVKKYMKWIINIDCLKKERIIKG